MNPELEALLKRIEAAGGPIHEGWNTDKPVWDAVFSEPDKYGYTTFTIGPKDDPRVGSESDALLIHALKLDTVARGARYRTTHEQGQHRVLLFDSTDVGHEIGAAWHQDNEVAAWCKAWLSAFEQEPA